MATKKRSIQKIPVELVQEPVLMVRSELTDSAEIKKLAESIGKLGLIEPIVVKEVEDRFVLIAGWRRLQAHKLLGMPLVEADVRVIDDETALQMRWAENDERLANNPADECRFIQEIVTITGKSQKDVALMLGKSEAFVSQRLSVLNGYPCIYEALGKGEITFNQARELVKFPDEQYARQYMHIAREQGAAAEVLRRWNADLKQDDDVMESVNQPKEPEDIKMPEELQFVCACCRNANYMRDVQILKLCPSCAQTIIQAVTTDQRVGK